MAKALLAQPIWGNSKEEKGHQVYTFGCLLGLTFLTKFFLEDSICFSWFDSKKFQRRAGEP